MNNEVDLSDWRISRFEKIIDAIYDAVESSESKLDSLRRIRATCSIFMVTEKRLIEAKKLNEESNV